MCTAVRRLAPALVAALLNDSDADEVARTTYMYDCPQPCNFKPSTCERANEDLPRPDGRQSKLNGWSEENEWGVGEVSW